MFLDLTDANLQPSAINRDVPEIVLSQQIRERLQAVFEEEENSAKIYPSTSIVQPDNNYVFFSNHWFYLAVLCRKYAEALYPYCVFFDNRIRNNQEITRDIAAERYNNPEFLSLFDSDEDRERMINFIRGDSDYRPGKALLNIRDGNRVTTRSCKDIFGSCVLKKLAVPDASSGYLGSVIYYLAKHSELYADLETEINEFIITANARGNADVIGRDENDVFTDVADNILLYGVPGCGKSYTIKTEYCDDDDHMERAVFHPDYTYSDFVGQILPRVDEGHIEYRFEPGPFTRILKKAVETPDESFYLVVEEINRGNAPAIFGDVFQLLDRDESGCSEYGVSNENISNHVYGDATTKIKIPGNLFVLATMNTSDQNVFTLDTAFKRRWTMRMIENNIDACEYADHQICAWGITWGAFARTINQKIIELGENNLSNEDNRLGAYFVREADLNNAERFGEKILMYLWNDAFKFDHDKVFKAEYRTLDELIAGFVRVGFAVFSDDIVFETIAEETDDIVETDNPTAEQYLEGKNPELVAAYRTLFEAVTARIPNAYDASVGSLTYAAWKANDIRKASFADIVIQRNRIVISCEVPASEAARTVGEQIPVDNHHNHYFRIIFDAAQTEQIVEAIVDSYNQLKVQ